MLKLDFTLKTEGERRNFVNSLVAQNQSWSTKELSQMADYIPDELACISLYEPCADCLNKLLSLNVDTILWSEPHKPKWNTDEYIQLTNDIWIGLKKNISNGRVIYKRAVHKKVTKFYDKVLRVDKIK